MRILIIICYVSAVSFIGSWRWIGTTFDNALIYKLNQGRKFRLNLSLDWEWVYLYSTILVLIINHTSIYIYSKLPHSINSCKSSKNTLKINRHNIHAPTLNPVTDSIIKKRGGLMRVDEKCYVRLEKFRNYFSESIARQTL